MLVRGRGISERFLRGVAAGGAALVVTGIGRLGEASPFLPEVIALGAFELLPVEVLERIAALGAWATRLLFIGTTVLVLLAGGCYGAVAGRPAPGGALLFAGAHAIGLAAALDLVVLPALGIDPLGAALPHELDLPAPVGLLGGALVYSVVLAGPWVSYVSTRSP